MRSVASEHAGELKHGERLSKEIERRDNPTDCAAEPSGFKRRWPCRAYSEMTQDEQAILDDFWNGRLHVLYDEAAREYGFGMARSSAVLAEGEQFAAQSPFRMPMI